MEIPQGIGYNSTMASTTYTQHYVNGTSQLVRRAVKQGRKAQGLGKEREIRLSSEQDAAITVLANYYGDFWNTNEFIRFAVAKMLCNSPYAELLNT